MIAAPGLTLHTQRQSDCLEVIETFVQYQKAGLIPNFIDENSRQIAYNTADASLWFGWAVQQYALATRDWGGVAKSFWAPLKTILHSYAGGTEFGIRMLPNGLVFAGEARTQLTWMDASVNGNPVTPRHGCPVEINALWYNLLCFVDELGKRFGEQVAPLKDGLIQRVAESFVECFWMEEKKCLADVWSEGWLDESIRPNQIFAASLPYSALPLEKARAVLSVVERELLAPCGVKTLSPRDPRYQGRCSGGPRERDSAYHNGTVWPWLAGHYCDALVRINGSGKDTAGKLARLAEGFRSHLGEAGLGTISEIFDGDPPHQARGCIAQAWSVAEALRLVCRLESMSQTT
jgi:predicted glycogen debranching enzyme